MEAIQALSDAQLRDELIKHGMKNLGPVMGTSRGIYEKKLFKLKQGAVSDKTKTKAEPTPAPASTSKTVKSTSRATRSTKKVVQKSESEDGSDEDIEIISPKKSTSKSSTSKPVSSTPVKDRTPSPPPVPARRKPNRPTNNIIPGLNTTTASSRSTTSNSSRLLIGAPGGDVPGSTPPRRALKTPIRPVTHTSATVTSSYLSPDASFHPSPKFSVQSSITRRGMANLGHTTEEEDSDGAGEETQRTVHNISSTGRDRRSGIRRALDGLLGNNLSAGSRPGDNYELRRGVTRTNVTRDARTGRLSIKQRSVWSDVPRVLLIILTLFLGILLTAYVVASRPDTIAGTVGVLRTAAKDTVEFFYRYAILPVAIVAGGTLLITGIYFAHRYYREKQAKEQVAFEDLVERIIDMVQISSEEGNENITVPHVRDKMYPPAKRSADDLKRWERAVDFINENESRIATECVLIRGQECQVWRWIPYKKSGWQGSAFPETTKSTVEMDKTPVKYLSPNVPTEALTRCLKIRDVRENREGKHADEPVNYDRLKLKVLDKIYPVRPVHFSFDTHSTEGVLYMKLGNLDDAKACFTALHAKWLNGNLVTVKYIRDRRYAERFPFTANA